MHKRRRRTELVALTIVILVSPNAKTKGGGPHVLLFDLCLSAIFIVVPCHFT